MFAAMTATSLLASGCCGSAFRVCDGPCSGGGGCDPCNWYPGKCLFDKIGCNSGCGKLYWSDWHSQPPDCCDPCDGCGNYAGRYYSCDPCGGGGGWDGGWDNGGYASRGAGCNCGGGGGHMGALTPTPQGEVIYEGQVRPGTRSTRATPTPIAPPPQARTTAGRPRPSQASMPRVRYNASTSTARQPQQRRIRPATHTIPTDGSWEEAEEIEPRVSAAPSGKPCTTCRR
jgi:hypothetical protein